MDCDFFWKRYSLKELHEFSAEELKGVVDDLRCKIQDALWELSELEENNVCLDVQASARMVVIDQLLDLRTERTRDLDAYFRGVQMSVKGIRQKKRLTPTQQQQQQRRKAVVPSNKYNQKFSGDSPATTEPTIRTS